MNNDTTLPYDSMMMVAGTVTVILCSCLGFVVWKSKKGENSHKDSIEPVIEEVEILDTSKYPGGYITVYYGTQTGTAENFSKDIEREGEDNGFKVDVVGLDDIEEDILGSLLNDRKKDDNGRNRAVFLMSTYGEGEPTDNAVSFIRFLKESHDANESVMGDSEEKKGEEYVKNRIVLRDLDYAVFGLGNTQYEHYNATGKATDILLEKSGASRMVQLGLGDDDADLEGDFESWKDNVLWPVLKKKYNSNCETNGLIKPSTEKLPDCHYEIEYLDGPTTHKDRMNFEHVQLSSKHYFTASEAPVTEKRELRSPADGGSTIHIEIDASDLDYQTADNLAILPVNDDATVERIAKALNYDLGSYFRLTPTKGHESKFTALFPTPCTVYECLAKYCDLVGPLRRSELKQLAQYAKDPTCKKALLRLASKEGKYEYKEKVMDAKVGIVDIISSLCPSISMPLEHFISLCPRLQPRYYTISSSSSVYSNSIHATVSVLSEERKDGSTFKGICSNYLSGMIKDGKVRAFIKDSTFRLPADASKPIIMIGPGTGIAPMRALLQERAYQRKVKKLNVGNNILYFGCKKRDHDFIYYDELNQYEKDGILTKMYVAFSREQSKKVYVQHLLSKNAKETWDLIHHEGAYIYVCGGVKMGHDVLEVLRKIVAEYGNLSNIDAKNYLEDLTTAKRFVQELWA